MTYTPSKLLSYEKFIALYGDNTQYELIDGELREIEPTGSHETVAGSIAGRLYLEIFWSNFNWLVPESCLIKPLYAEVTALRSDVVFLDKAELGSKPLWQKEPAICKDSIHKLFAEVVITNGQNNYAKKSERIRFFKDCKILDWGLSRLKNLRFIGSLKQPNFIVC
jgi:hypothetical protein